MDSLVLAGSSDWKGYSALSYLFVFGASYCDIGYDNESPHPTKAEPLGVTFPGKTYAGEGKPNWVGILARELCPSGSGCTDPLLVFDYAVGGVVISGVRSQVYDQFLEAAGKKPSWASWSAEDSLFVTWTGIKYCGQGNDPAEGVSELFKIQEKLYETGARIFLLIDSPPMSRSPIGLSQRSGRRDPYFTWNIILRSDARGFVEEHPDASIFIFSAWKLFSEVLDDPAAFGFVTDGPEKEGGGIWLDQVHPTAEMHRLIAERIHELLCNIKEGGHNAGSEDVEVVFG